VVQHSCGLRLPPGVFPCVDFVCSCDFCCGVGSSSLFASVFSAAVSRRAVFYLQCFPRTTSFLTCKARFGETAVAAGTTRAMSVAWLLAPPLSPLPREDLRLRTTTYPTSELGEDMLPVTIADASENQVTSRVRFWGARGAYAAAAT